MKENGEENEVEETKRSKLTRAQLETAEHHVSGMTLHQIHVGGFVHCVPSGSVFILKQEEQWKNNCG